MASREERSLAAVKARGSANTDEQERVLVIEDDPVVVDLIQDIVASMGYGVVVAETAPEGLEAFESNCDTAVCVILDYSIPGMDASRLLSRIHEIKKDAKVLLSSGYSKSFIGQDFPLEQVDGFIAKPYEPQVLVAELTRLIGRRP